MRNALFTIGLLSLILVAGCWETTFTLIAPDKAKVDKALVGNWNSDSFDGAGREAGLVVRNIDDKLYYVEWKMKGESQLVRGVGFTTDVKGATFTQLRGLEDDGNVQQSWIVMRLELSANTLKIRQLDDDFMKKQKIESAEQLRLVLEGNLNKDEMYNAKETITATRVVVANPKN